MQMYTAAQLRQMIAERRTVLDLSERDMRLLERFSLAEGRALSAQDQHDLERVRPIYDCAVAKLRTYAEMHGTLP